jgi:hypothetical protein
MQCRFRNESGNHNFYDCKCVTGLESAVRLEVERIRIDMMLDMSHTAAPGMTRMLICDQNTLFFFSVQFSGGILCEAFTNIITSGSARLRTNFKI